MEIDLDNTLPADLDVQADIPNPETDADADGNDWPVSPRYPDVVVQLTGRDGNAGAIMGAVAQALRRAGADFTEVDEFRREAMSGDYSHLLQTAEAWVEVR